MQAITYEMMAESAEKHWWWEGRRAVVSSTLRALAIPRSSRLLDIGCGAGQEFKWMAGFGKVEGLETHPPTCAVARQTGNEVHLGDVEKGTDFPAASFDLIFMLDVLEHLEKDGPVLAECRRLLKPGGHLLITVPAYRFLWSGMDDALMHKRRYTAGKLEKDTLGAGFRTVRLTYFNTLLFPIAVVQRLVDKAFHLQKSVEQLALPSPAVNGLLRSVFVFEAFLLRMVSFPFGLSLMAVVRKAT